MAREKGREDRRKHQHGGPRARESGRVRGNVLGQRTRSVVAFRDGDQESKQLRQKRQKRSKVRTFKRYVTDTISTVGAQKAVK